MCFFVSSDFSTVEIGKLLGITANAVEVRLYRARKRMKEELGDVV